MKKWIILAPLILALGFMSYLFIQRSEILSEILSKTLAVTVRIKSIDLHKNGLTIKALQIGNPAGCAMKNAFFADRIDVTMNWMQILKGMFSDASVTIDEININNTKMNIELFNIGGSDNNLTRILAQLSDQTNQAPSAQQYVIRMLRLTNIQLNVVYHGFIGRSLTPAPIAQIELKNLGSDGPEDTRAVLVTVFTSLLQETAKQLDIKGMVTEALLKKILPPPLMMAEEIREIAEKGYQFFSPKKRNSTQQPATE